ncbi:hypothetical protein [Shewanella scandinavica]|uniref:hypothetical protein n=1 Tax=Shewanella scandinavica TaxID=3063538 RepID=UPI0031894134
MAVVFEFTGYALPAREVVMTLKAMIVPYISVLHLTNEIVESLVNQTEKIIESEIKKYRASGPETFEIELCKEEGIFECIEHYHGLSDSDVILDDMFLEYFPCLNRRSVFQTIYGIYEADLLGLCRGYHKSLGGKKPDKFDGSGIVQAHNFLSKHYPELVKSKEWGAIDQLRLLRNKCVHNNGCVFERKKPIADIDALIESHPHLFHHDGIEDPEQSRYSDGSVKRLGRNIVLEKGSLNYIIDAFKAYVKLVDETHRKARITTHQVTP